MEEVHERRLNRHRAEHTSVVHQARMHGSLSVRDDGLTPSNVSSVMLSVSDSHHLNSG